jgi:D-tagatose-1,6-bisphosphate aldolase subunit GatZ/KbaZ
MVRHPEHWENYYRGKYEQCAYKRKYSLSYRVRYYWPMPKVQLAFERLLKNLGGKPLSLSLVSQFLPVQYAQIRAGELDNEPRAIIWDKINNVLDGYAYACG